MAQKQGPPRSFLGLSSVMESAVGVVGCLRHHYLWGHLTEGLVPWLPQGCRAWWLGSQRLP